MIEATKYTWKIEKALGSGILSELVSRWYLDNPKNGQSDDTATDITIRGWALAASEQQPDLHVVLQTIEGTYCHRLTVERPDVVSKILHRETAGPRELLCGFMHSLPKPLFFPGVTLGFETDGSIHPTVSIRLIPLSEAPATQGSPQSPGASA